MPLETVPVLQQGHTIAWLIAHKSQYGDVNLYGTGRIFAMR